MNSETAHRRVFVSEYVCGGAWPGENLETSLAREGRAMLLAVVSDLLRIPGCEVVTTWDRRLGEFPRVNSGLTVYAAGPRDEAALFEELCRNCEAVLVIAPETHGVLSRRTSIAARCATVLGSDALAVELCSDKFRLAGFLTDHDISTVPTAALDLARPCAAWPFPVVMKPRDGAGSVQTFRVDDSTELEQQSAAARQAEPGLEFIQQPFVPGETISVAVIRDRNGPCEVLPVCHQVLSQDGRFEYLGADWSPAFTSAWQAETTRLIRQVLDAIRGLAGYVGFDLIGSDDGSAQIVDINARLTTSYLGWRATNGNLAAAMLGRRETLIYTNEPMTFRLDSYAADADAVAGV